MRARNRVAILLVMLAIIGVCAGVAASQTNSKPPSTSTVAGTDDEDKEKDGGVRGQADSGPAFTGMIIGLLLIAMISLFFAVYMRDRH